MSRSITFLNAAAVALFKSNKPLSLTEIFIEVQKLQLTKPSSLWKPSYVKHAITKDIRKKANNSLFVKTEQGKYTIKRDVIENYFEKECEEGYKLIDHNKVLAIFTSLLNRNEFLNETRFDIDNISKMISAELRYFRHFSIEQDSEVKQIVNFIITLVQDKLILYFGDYSQSNNIDSNNMCSIGLVRHIEEIDRNLFSFSSLNNLLIENARRCIVKKLHLKNDAVIKSINTIGVVNERCSDFGRTHLGFIQLVELKESSHLLIELESSIQFSDVQSIYEKFGYFNLWSAKSLVSYLGDWLKKGTSIQPRRGFALNKNRQCLAIIGNNKKTIERVCALLEFEFGYTRILLHDANNLSDNLISTHKNILLTGFDSINSIVDVETRLSTDVGIIFVEDVKTPHCNDHIAFNEQIGESKQTEVNDYTDIYCIWERADVIIYCNSTSDELINEVRNYFKRELIDDVDHFLTAAWNINAPFRHKQIISGLDTTFNKLLAPKIISVLKSTPGYQAFDVLDVGCGTGTLTALLASHVTRVTGIDPSSESIKIASFYSILNSKLDFRCESIETFSGTAQNKFNFIVANMVLHSIKNLRIAIQSVSHLLASGGYFVFTIPHPILFPEHKMDVFDNKNYVYDSTSFFKIPFTISNDRMPLPSRTPYFHRPLDTYFAELQNYGLSEFSNETLNPDPETKSWYFSKHKKWHILLIICRKLGKDT